MAILTGCTSTPDNTRHSNLLHGIHDDIKLVLIDKDYFFNLMKSDEADFQAKLAELKAREALSDDIDYFFQQIFAAIPFYGENWSEYFTNKLTFYGEGIRQLTPFQGIEVFDQHGQELYKGFQLQPTNHLLEISLSTDKNTIDGDLTVRLTYQSEDTPGTIEFTIPNAALTTTSRNP